MDPAREGLVACGCHGGYRCSEAPTDAFGVGRFVTTPRAAQAFCKPDFRRSNEVRDCLAARPGLGLRARGMARGLWQWRGFEKKSCVKLNAVPGLSAERTSEHAAGRTRRVRRGCERSDVDGWSEARQAGRQASGRQQGDGGVSVDVVCLWY